jgi:ABC-type lipoprotein export system ATPase subunit
MITLTNVLKNYGPTTVLKIDSLQIQKGEHVVVCGRSGSGKSTLMYLIGGLESISSGSIYAMGTKLHAANDDQLSAYRANHVGFVFQFHYLLPTLNVKENILLPFKLHGFKKYRGDLVLQKLMQTVGIDQLATKFPFELSGGEQQRVSLLRSLIHGPDLILCDEPTGNLDTYHSGVVIKLLRSLATELSSTLIVVTHDLSMASTFPRKIVIEDGRLIS